MGTPTAAAWPEVDTLPDYQQQMFPKWAPKPLRKLCPGLDGGPGLDLLSVRVCVAVRCCARAIPCINVTVPRARVQKLLTLDPAQRTTARAAMEHAFFLDLDRSAL
jgi:hypothetical protein